MSTAVQSQAESASAAELEALPTRELLIKCITRTEAAVASSDRACRAAEESRDTTREIKALVTRQATALVAAQHGIPLTRSGRYAVAGVLVLTVLLSVFASVGVVACTHEPSASASRR